MLGITSCWELQVVEQQDLLAGFPWASGWPLSEQSLGLDQGGPTSQTKWAAIVLRLRTWGATYGI